MLKQGWTGKGASLVMRERAVRRNGEIEIRIGTSPMSSFYKKPTRDGETWLPPLNSGAIL